MSALLAMGLGVAGLPGGNQGANAMSQKQRPRAKVALSCPEAGAQADALCAAMTQSLARAVPGAIIAQVARGAEAPERQGDHGVALYLDSEATSAIAAHLVWWEAPGTAPVTGAAMRMDVMDAALSSAVLQRFTDDLLRAGPGPVAE